MSTYRLLITDMSREELAEQKERYEGWTILSPEKEIHPCIGCFSCVSKGKCVFDDVVNEKENKRSQFPFYFYFEYIY